MKKINLIGKKYGKLTVLEECDCGNIVYIVGHRLRNGETRSCGCLNSYLSKLRQTKHSLSDSKLYSIYTNIKTRCYNKNNCRWVDMKTHTISEWAELLGLSYNTIWKRCYKHKSIKDILHKEV